MKVHTTNYQNTFIQIADDCPIGIGDAPPIKGNIRTVANRQFDMILKSPYQYTSDEVMFQIFADRNGLAPSDYKEAREHFFSKGQPCFRSSPLTKRYGWGIHFDKDGKMAIYGAETNEYKNFSTDPTLKIVKAMKSNRQLI